MAFKKIAVAVKTTGKALANYDDELAALAKKSRKLESSVSLGAFISTKGGQLTINGSPVPDNTMNVVIVDHLLENVFYGEDFDDDNPRAPECYAFSTPDDEDGKLMVPHEKASDKQNEKCDGCRHNKFNTARKGKGKACKNIRRLAMIVASESEMDNIAGAEVRYMKLPVTSVKAWAAYVKQLDDVFSKPPLAFITEVKTVPTVGEKALYKVVFAVVEAIDDRAKLRALLDRRKLVEAEMAIPYMENAEEPAPAPRGRAVAKKPNPKFARR